MTNQNIDYFLSCVLLVMGLLFIAQIIHIRMKKDYLKRKYGSGSKAYSNFIAVSGNKSLIAGVAFTVAILIRVLFDIYNIAQSRSSDTTATLIQIPLSVLGLVVITFVLGAALLKKPWEL